MQVEFPDVHANDRDIPAGKVLVAEYGQIADTEPRARPITLKRRKAWGRTDVDLVACPAGWAIAGSMLRWDNGWYGIRYEAGGAIHGRRFRTIGEAVEVFNKLPA